MFKVHLFCSIGQYFIPFHCQVILQHMDTSHFAYGHLGFSYFSVVIKNAGISIKVFIYAYFFISLEYRFRS